VAVLNAEEEKSLLVLARSVLQAKLLEKMEIKRPAELTPALAEKRGCFVTLHKNKALRGCIGTIEPVQSLVAAIEENALNAAFKDPRFPPLQAAELPLIQIEVSVLSVPEKLVFEDGEDLKRQLKPGVHGVILSRGWHGSTFLPQVWSQLPEKEDFLEHLCRKGGMEPNCWQDKRTTVKVYEAYFFSE